VCVCQCVCVCGPGHLLCDGRRLRLSWRQCYGRCFHFSDVFPLSVLYSGCLCVHIHVCVALDVLLFVILTFFAAVLPFLKEVKNRAGFLQLPQTRSDRSLRVSPSPRYPDDRVFVLVERTSSGLHNLFFNWSLNATLTDGSDACSSITNKLRTFVRAFSLLNVE